ncbi:hypothetical protein BUALT_Bualt03G0176500 [Buddleja alternifolia]|uniref:Uncharacterized protein n=1 Tax=Buddleja alternifolia TaxID=168488 RepID=A0AAV6XWE5_9LAMI|nr:hypothetical protein BUALT_Bualt03G0176500 [Buddleja alternifolia]
MADESKKTGIQAEKDESITTTQRKQRGEGNGKVDAVDSAAAGEAVTWGLLRQRMRDLRLGLVLEGTRGVQQALQGKFYLND